MDDSEDLLSIGAFARRVGMTPSALRFYDDCGVLRPARVDAVTGYRRYGAGQAARAVRLRRLREAGLPLVDVAVVLDGTEQAAQDVLRAHLARLRRTVDQARDVVERFLAGADAEPGHGGSRARVGGAELASAVRQVVPAAATGAAREEFPVLGGVLLELGAGEVRLVATDRYRLAVRVLRPMECEGGHRRLLIGADAARSLAEWAVRRAAVDVECAGDGTGLRLWSEGDCRTVPEGAGEGQDGGVSAAAFPDYRLMLEGMEAGRHRVIVDRVGLRDAVAGRAGAVSLSLVAGGTDPGQERSNGPGGRLVSRETAAGAAAEDAVEVSGGGRAAVRLGAVRTGPWLPISFDPAVLVPALEAGVGPDVLLEAAAADRPVVVRSADQGSFTTLVMPVHGAGPGGGR
ncbi:MerR family transcriptional regulator [Streptomyces sp. NPDC056411]|uniref:DNA polymerase III subunit beta family protein n=1 Tax=Streptomyces sp. NPDC056411 TaxID=3345813 RepID=UPI0035D54E14